MIIHLSPIRLLTEFPNSIYDLPYGVDDCSNQFTELVKEGARKGGRHRACRDRYRSRFDLPPAPPSTTSATCATSADGPAAAPPALVDPPAERKKGSKVNRMQRQSLDAS